MNSELERDIVERLRNHALPDPHDEREVLHAPLLKEAANEITRLRAALSTEAQPEVTGAVAWQFYSDGKWHNGMDTNNHRQNTIDAGYPVRDLYPPSAIEGYAQELAKRLVREKLEEAILIAQEFCNYSHEQRSVAQRIRALIQQD